MKQKHLGVKHNRGDGQLKPHDGMGHAKPHLWTEHKQKYPAGNAIAPHQNPLTGQIGSNPLNTPDQQDQGEVTQL